MEKKDVVRVLKSLLKTYSGGQEIEQLAVDLDRTSAGAVRNWINGTNQPTTRSLLIIERLAKEREVSV